MSELPSSDRAIRAESHANASDSAEDASSEDVSLLDLLLVLVEKRSLIVRTALVAVLLGSTYAFLASDSYVSTAKLSRESEQSGGGLSQLGGLGALSGGLGINLGTLSGGGMNSAAFQEVLESREVRLSVARDTFWFPDAQKRMTFVEYVDQPAGLLQRIIDAVMRGDDAADTTGTNATAVDGGIRKMTEQEGDAVEMISQLMSSSINQDSGLMTVSVQAGDPVLSAEVASSFIRHLTDRVRELRTAKVRERVAFVESRFQEVGAELNEAEDDLAQFLEQNQNPTTATLKFQEDRLRRQVNFKQQLYSDLRGQLTQARLDLQRQQPVVTVVEKPVPPLQKSGPNRLLFIILSGVVGVLLGCGIAITLTLVQVFRHDKHQQEKLDRLSELLLPISPFSGASSSTEEQRTEEHS
ncbi:hypothetical protein CRI94_05700 [Longibacter salinarum]|uniref:Lipopolysaccharide biosynthesis protein n=1 Tax=Longibacter salinarum TaxID=1850348 RepID=A0A2A8D1J0_9BACT|nr:Wzz/FepE/Etk N-terminal domain-containing protein [Longibacter salinarum]PEN14518.1 hypothetical protein CRI94_05700 [Longibacter salinarum]